MTKTPSTMLPLDTKAPDFNLLDPLTNTYKNYSDCKKENGLLVAFICNHCPFVKHIEEQFVVIANEYLKNEVGVVAISSNDIINYPEDSPKKMKDLAKNLEFPFPYLYDESQDIAKAYQAACTPDFFLFNKEDKLTYRGQMDDSRPDNSIEVTGDDLIKAFNNMLNGEAFNDQKPSIGCNIKWKE